MRFHELTEGHYKDVHLAISDLKLADHAKMVPLTRLGVVRFIHTYPDKSTLTIDFAVPEWGKEVWATNEYNKALITSAIRFSRQRNVYSVKQAADILFGQSVPHSIIERFLDWKVVDHRTVLNPAALHGSTGNRPS